MRKLSRIKAACAAVVPLLATGCSGPDDLQVTNRFSFAVQLQKQGESLGTVQPGQTQTFNGKGGFKGQAADDITCLDAQGKSLGTLAKAAHDVQRENNGSFNGSGVLTAILGP